MKKILLILSFCTVAISVFAQETPFFRIPRQKSFEVGYKYLVANSFSKTAVQGETYWFDYAWQLRGFNGIKNAVYISIPIGYTMLHGGSTAANIHILEYGWTVRHELCHQKAWIPWLGYALLLNNLQISDRSGSLFGHQTRFEFGVARNKNEKRVNPFIKFEYGYARFAQFNDTKSNVLQNITLKLGLHF